MSGPAKTLHPDEKVKAGTLGGTLFKAGIPLALGAMVLSIILGSRGDDHFRRFFYAYVVAWMFVASIAVGSLFIVLLHHLTRSRWTTVVRRLAENITGAFPLIWLAGLGIVIPLLAGYKGLYYWSTPEAHGIVNGVFDSAINEGLQHKLGWLDPTFFSIRFVVYGAIYIALSRYFAAKSREQDESGDPEISTRLRVASAPGMILFAVVTCFLAFDVLMSLAPKWYSTIYGVNYWAGGMIAAFSTLTLLTLAVQRSGRLVHSITPEHYHDLGKWLFAWTFFWAYTAFSQFMLQWYGNMPEETVWYKYRMFSEWQWVSIAMLVGHFAFPFLFLMSRWTKRIVPSLVFFAVWQLVFHWVDIYWNAMPQYDWHESAHNGSTYLAGPLMGATSEHFVHFSAVDITLWISMIGILVAGIGRSMTGNLIPVKDPTLGLSLAHENL